jgi:DNA-binding transcriptional regulator LsrR (DeoR family)
MTNRKLTKEDHKAIKYLGSLPDMTGSQISKLFGISRAYACRLISEDASKRNYVNKKLTDSQVIEIRERYESEPVSTRILAKEYNVSNMQISRIINYKNRKDVKGG